MAGIAFEVDARRGDRHLFDIELRIARSVWPDPRRCELFLPAWTPGSYLIREYARHVTGFEVADPATGTTIRHRKTAKNRFLLDGAGGWTEARIRYAVFAHELTVRTADLTGEHAFWNGACLFLWPVGAPRLQATIDLRLPTGWRAWTALPLEPGDDGSARIVADDLDRLIDAPLLAAPDATVLDFTAVDRPHRFVLDGLGSATPASRLVDDTRAVIEQTAKVFAVEELPYSRYDFLTLFTDAGGGGLEHADSSVLLVPRTTFASRKGYQDLLGLVAHEFFHVFNAKRMRPAELWQIDYERENHTRLLWVVEGFTAYYDDLLCCRAGVLPRGRYLQVLADNIADAHRTPGRLAHPLAESSFDAWIKLYRPDESTRNTSQSYYVNGSLAALCLDLEILDRTDGARGLDAAMARLYRDTYGASRGYTHADVVAALSAAADADLGDLVDRLVNGPFDPDFTSLLHRFGMDLSGEPDGEPTPNLGLALQPNSTTVVAVRSDGPAAAAGITAGDELLALDDLRLGASNLDDVLRALPEKTIDVLLARRGRIVRRQIALGDAAPRTKLSIKPRDDASAREKRLVDRWLEPR